MSLASSAASFVSTGSAAKNTPPRSRKASKPAGHAANLDAAQRALDSRAAQGEDVSKLVVDPTTYEIVTAPTVETVVVDPVPSSLVAMFAEQQVAAPKSRSKAPDMELVVLKQFKPRTNQLIDRKFENKGNFAQDHNWAALTAAIAANGGSISYTGAVAAVEAAGKAGLYEKTCNARGFVQGRVRHGHIGTRSVDDGIAICMEQAAALLAG